MTFFAFLTFQTTVWKLKKNNKKKLNFIHDGVILFTWTWHVDTNISDNYTVGLTSFAEQTPAQPVARRATTVCIIYIMTFSQFPATWGPWSVSRGTARRQWWRTRCTQESRCSRGMTASPWYGKLLRSPWRISTSQNQVISQVSFSKSINKLMFLVHSLSDGY